MNAQLQPLKQRHLEEEYQEGLGHLVVEGILLDRQLNLLGLLVVEVMLLLAGLVMAVMVIALGLVEAEERDIMEGEVVALTTEAEALVI
jgi:hypothetical protein